MIRYEYRVRWLRVGGDVHTKIYQTHRAARRRVDFMGPEPWRANGRDPDAQFCCSGYECGCGGRTVREALLAPRGDGTDGTIPPLMFAEVQRRRVEEWEAMPLPETLTVEGRVAEGGQGG